MSCLLLVLVAVFIDLLGAKKEVDFISIGGIPGNSSWAAKTSNRDLLTGALSALEEGDTFLIPNMTFHSLGGIVVEQELKNVKIVLGGTIRFDHHKELWPRSEDGSILECMQFAGLESSILTTLGNDTSNRGTLEGGGVYWWDLQNINNDRPRLLSIQKSTDLVLERWRFSDSPFWSVWAQDSNGLVVRNCDAITSIAQYHPEDHGFVYRIFRWFWVWILTRFRFTTFLTRLNTYRALNTDGFDFSGSSVYGHDLYISTGDDAIAVKGGSDMLFERLQIESGLGLAIGSLSSGTVENITFRDAKISNSVKGIYIKTNSRDEGEGATIRDIVYENITIVEPLQFGIWIGPSQQMGGSCSLKFPQFKNAKCEMSPAHTLTNITLRSIRIVDPYFSPGIILGNESNPMTELTFEDVQVVSARRRHVDPSLRPWGLNYLCTGVSQSYASNCYPSPDCFYSDEQVTASVLTVAGAAVLSFAAATLI